MNISVRGKPRISEYGSIAVANYIIERSDLKINKLIYFIYGTYLAAGNGNPFQ